MQFVSFLMIISEKNQKCLGAPWFTFITVYLITFQAQQGKYCKHFIAYYVKAIFSILAKIWTDLPAIDYHQRAAPTNSSGSALACWTGSSLPHHGHPTHSKTSDPDTSSK
jgi:hypothetical protein